MPDLQAIISPLVRGNDLDVIRWVNSTEIPVGQTLTDGWLAVQTIVTPPATPSQLFQKHITTALVGGEGQITLVVDVWILRFEITSTNSLLMTGGTVAVPAQHPYGIQTKTSAAKINEFEQGVIKTVEQIVTAS
jgi:hypothetical protein